ncbi:MAG TPA: hypothetical protein VFS67_08755 [Polyangiaceae bacterium]|nr:hypothetical protein [Polyangiaceae bacterium]
MLLTCALPCLACRSSQPTSASSEAPAAQAPSSASGERTLPASQRAPAGERAPIERDPRLLPPDRPLQHLAFSEQRLAQLSGDELLLRRMPDLRGVKRIGTPGARNLVAGVGGDFVAAGSNHVYRVAQLDDSAEVLAPVPRLGPTTILPGADSSDHFWLLYEGIPRLPEFDLQETVIAPYVSVLSWTQLSEFDGRAISNPGDGSFIFTTPGGLRRVSAEGRTQRVVAPSLGERVWRLLPASGAGMFWAATPYDLQLLQRMSGAQRSAAPSADWECQSAQRIELPRYAVALSAQGRDLAVLAVESFEPTRARLRIELYRQGSDERRVIRFDEAVPAPADGGAPVPEFAPELALAPGQPWVAVSGFGLSVFDGRTGARLFPKGASSPSTLLRSQNLAPDPR